MDNVKVRVGSTAGGQIAVDSELSLLSENPVQNKAVTAALNGKQDTLTIDSALSETSENPVQNRVITAALNGRQDSLKSLTYTGTGNASHSITFPEKPTLLLALQGSSGGGYLQFAPVEYGGTQWNYIWSNSYVNGSGGNVGLTYSADDLTMTMTHSNADGAAACNLSGVTYTLYYI